MEAIDLEHRVVELERRLASLSARYAALKRKLDRPTRTDGVASVRDACDFLRVSRSQIYILLKQGAITSVKDGGRRKFHWSELHQYIRRIGKPLIGSKADLAG